MWNPKSYIKVKRVTRLDSALLVKKTDGQKCGRIKSNCLNFTIRKCHQPEHPQAKCCIKDRNETGRCGGAETGITEL